MEKVKLLPEQVAVIKTKIEELNKHIAEIQQDYINQDRKGLVVWANEFGGAGPDIVYFNDLSRSRKELNELTELLRNAEIIDVYDSGKIEVGTKFVATININSELITRKYVLIDGALSLDLSIGECIPVSINSPFGHAVRSKCENDVVVYATPDNKVATGIIEEIIDVKENTCSNNGFQLVK